jgi:hypothetical protein
MQPFFFGFQMVKPHAAAYIAVAQNELHLHYIVSYCYYSAAVFKLLPSLKILRLYKFPLKIFRNKKVLKYKILFLKR